MTTWRKLILEEMEERGESFDDVVEAVADAQDGWLDVEFFDGYGGAEGCSFSLWTEKRVYFPICYDGAEWAGSVPRNPCKEASTHQGGG